MHRRFSAKEEVFKTTVNSSKKYNFQHRLFTGFALLFVCFFLKNTRFRLNVYSERFPVALEEVLGSFSVPKMYAKSIQEGSFRHVQIPKRFGRDFDFILEAIFGLPWWDPAKTFALEAFFSCDVVLELSGYVSEAESGRILVAS